MTLKHLIDNLDCHPAPGRPGRLGVLLLLVDLFIPKERKGWTALLAAVGLVVALGLTLAQNRPARPAAFNGMVVVDGFAIFLNVLFLASGLAGLPWPTITSSAWASNAANITSCCCSPSAA